MVTPFLTLHYGGKINCFGYIEPLGGKSGMADILAFLFFFWSRRFSCDGNYFLGGEEIQEISYDVGTYACIIDSIYHSRHVYGYRDGSNY
jgi:hypothetical protein